MQNIAVLFARKPLSRPANLQPARRTRHSVLARLRDDIAILRTIKFNHVTIGRVLQISPEDARALSPTINKPGHAPRLTRHAIKAMLYGRHADLGGKAISTRAKNLLKIAAAYTFEELLEEPGVGSVTAGEIQLWLEERGASLRPSD